MLKQQQKQKSKEEDSFRLAEHEEKINACLSFEDNMREVPLKLH